MHRVPYEIVIIEAERLTVAMALSPTLELARRCWREYISWLNLCGWSDRDFDKEMLRRIDIDWNIQYVH